MIFGKNHFPKNDSFGERGERKRKTDVWEREGETLGWERERKGGEERRKEKKERRREKQRSSLLLSFPSRDGLSVLTA